MFLPDHKLQKALKTLDDFAYNLIRERRNDPKLEEKGDMLSQYIVQTKENDKYLRDMIMNFMIAGRDTTGQTLQWLFYLLSQNHDVEQKLVKEIEEKLGDNRPTFEDLKDMPYLEGVI